MPSNACLQLEPSVNSYVLVCYVLLTIMTISIFGCILCNITMCNYNSVPPFWTALKVYDSFNGQTYINWAYLRWSFATFQQQLTSFLLRSAVELLCTKMIINRYRDAAVGVILQLKCHRSSNQRWQHSELEEQPVTGKLIQSLLMEPSLAITYLWNIIDLIIIPRWHHYGPNFMNDNEI